MKLHNIWLPVTIILLQLSCKKTDHYAQLVNNQPYIVTGGMDLSSFGIQNYIGYPTSFFVGDTATFVGRLFVNNPGFKIQVGNDTAHLVFHAQLPQGINQYTHQTDELDVVRFVITQSMGLGNRVPVSVTANGVTISAPTLSISQFLGIKRQTDTTLRVDSLSSWQLPAALQTVYSNYYNYPLTNTSLSGEGVVCFSTISAIYALQNGQINQWLAAGNQLQENGTAYSISLILGSVLSFAGDTLTFSAQVSENIPDTATNYIFRICKMSLATRQVITINRTEVIKGIPAIAAAPGPYQGPIGSLPIVAVNLKTDANGSLYFLNDYPVANPANDNTNNWYVMPFSPGISQGGIDINIFGTNPYVLSNICRSDVTGKVKSIFSEQNPSYPLAYQGIPGYPLILSSDYLPSLDGQTCYGINSFNNTSDNFNLAYISLQTDALLISTASIPAFRFFSYDTSSVTGGFGPGSADATLTSFAVYLLYGQYLNNLMILPDGDLLYEINYSLVALNFENKTSYCYAGTEQGINDLPPASQIQTTGPAKYVNWQSAVFIGADKYDNIYYFENPGGNIFNFNFYTLHSKK